MGMHVQREIVVLNDIPMLGKTRSYGYDRLFSPVPHKTERFVQIL